jgi:predicted Zn-dependent peptidase
MATHTPSLKKLENGLRILTIPMKDSLSTTIAVFVEAGSAYEDKANNGISHFLEHMCFKGTSKRPTAMDISMELESMGASYNAFTSRDMTGYHAKVAPRHFERAFDIVADMYLNPLLQPEEIEKEKGVIVEEINMYEDQPNAKVSEALEALLYKDQPAGWGIAGTKDNVRAMTRENFAAYRAKHYVASKTVIVIAGPVTPAQVVAHAKKYFAVLPLRPRASRIRTAPTLHDDRIAAIERKLDQTHFCIGFKTAPASSPERYALSMMSRVLGGGMSSRLFQVIRGQMGAAYYIGASNNFFATHGYGEVAGGLNHGKVHDVLKETMRQLALMRDEKVSPKELKRAQEFSIGNFLLSLESSSDFAFYYGDDEAALGKIERPEEVIKQLRAVTADQVRRIARKYIRQDNLYLSIIGPYGAQDAEKLKKLLVL